MALTKEEIRKLYGESDPKKMSFFNKIKMLFLHPAHFFAGVKGESLKPAFTMFLVFFLISSIIREVLNLQPELLSPVYILMQLFDIGIGFAIMFFFAWIHIFVRLLGGKNGVKQTFKAFMYASVPPTIVSSLLYILMRLFFSINLFNLINFVTPLLVGPVLNPSPLFSSLLSLGLVMIPVVISIWGLYLYAVGIGKLHEISTGRGIGAIILAVVILLIIISLIGFFFIFSQRAIIGP